MRGLFPLTPRSAFTSASIASSPRSPAGRCGNIRPKRPRPGGAASGASSPRGTLAPWRPESSGGTVLDELDHLSPGERRERGDRRWTVDAERLRSGRHRVTGLEPGWGQRRLRAPLPAEGRGAPDDAPILLEGDMAGEQLHVGDGAGRPGHVDDS